MDAPALLRGVTKSFGGVTVLELDELEVRPGEFHALIGQNGSGKSTIIKLLAGYHEPDAYETALASGVSVALGSPSTPHKAGWRFVHQDLGLVDALSAVDNLALGVGYSTGLGGRIDWRTSRREAQEAIERLGYDFDVRLPLVNLAPVERTAVAVARALREQGTKSSMLVLDEPTATMPRPEVERLLELARRVASSGTAVLFVTHHLDEVMGAADRVTVLRDGKVVETTQVSEVTKGYLVEQMTGGLIQDVRVDIDARELKRVETPVLTARGISGRHVHDLDLEVYAGEILGIAGITGSGRDELASLLFGRLPRGGELTVNEKTVRAHDPASSIDNGIALVPAQRVTHGLAPQLSVRENMTLPDLSKFWQGFRLRVRQERQEVKSLRSTFGIRGGHDEQPIVTLSGGNQQKSVIAKWMRLEPAVLVLDEPTQGVDVGSQAEIHRLLAHAAENGAAILLCSSDEVELAAVCNRVLVLQGGHIVRELVGDQVNVPTIVRSSLSAEEVVTQGAPR